MSEVHDRSVSGRYLLGARLRSFRHELGVTMADAAHSAGISYSYLSDVERGRQLPSLEVLDVIATVLDTSVLSLLEGPYPWDGRADPTPATPPPDGRRSRSTRA